jgi:hypothetical protein
MFVDSPSVIQATVMERVIQMGKLKEKEMRMVPQFPNFHLGIVRRVVLE